VAINKAEGDICAIPGQDLAGLLALLGEQQSPHVSTLWGNVQRAVGRGMGLLVASVSEVLSKAGVTVAEGVGMEAGAGAGEGGRPAGEWDERVQGRFAKLYGLDVLVGEDGEAWLLEVNCAPSVSTACAEHIRVKNGCVCFDDCERVWGRGGGASLATGGVGGSVLMMCDDVTSNHLSLFLSLSLLCNLLHSHIDIPVQNAPTSPQRAPAYLPSFAIYLSANFRLMVHAFSPSHEM
jgi:hypothetical protein